MSSIKQYRSLLLRWRAGSSEAEIRVLDHLRQGDLSLWLDPLLPLYAFASPEKYGPVLTESAVRAGIRIAQGEHLNEPRLPIRNEDDYGLLRSYLVRVWKEPMSYLQRLFAVYPWPMPYQIDDGEWEHGGRPSGSLCANPGAFLITDSWEFLSYTRDVLRLLEKVGVPLSGVLKRRGCDIVEERPEQLLEQTPELLTELKEWSSYPLSRERSWSAVFHDRVRDTVQHKIISYYLADTDSLVDYPFTLSGVGVDDYGAVLDEEGRLLRERHPTCPLLKYLPEKDRYRFEEYATLSEPNLFTYEDQTKEGA